MPSTRLRDRLTQLLSKKKAAASIPDLLDNDMEVPYATYDAREASFAPPTKRGKGWPHKSPSPPDLAKAGFFWKPTSTKDNVECFMCGRHLDGWEADDDALQEHLKHGSDCAWAVLMSTAVGTKYDVDDMDDPTSTAMVEARRNTFETLQWPHESKRGWTCKTEKMVEAGWHFAPTTECEDYTSCVYCNLSLDGWEPKDNPFDEHYRRSPDCPFFVFAGTSQPSKRPKKKGSRPSRTSKASRLSTQSSVAMSQADESTDIIEVLGVDTTIEETVQDNSIMSIQSTTSTATTRSKRKAPTRTKAASNKQAKTSRSKKATRESQPEPETQQTQDTDMTDAEPVAAPAKKTRGRKKKQDVEETEMDTQQSTQMVEEQTQPHPKKTRGQKKKPVSIVDLVSEPEIEPVLEAGEDVQIEVETAPETEAEPEEEREPTPSIREQEEAVQPIEEEPRRRSSSGRRSKSLKSEAEAIAALEAEIELENQAAKEQQDGSEAALQTPTEEFQSAAEMPGAFGNSPDEMDDSFGPPTKESTPVPVKQTSPLKEVTNPPRPTISPAQIEQPSKRRSSRRSSRKDLEKEPSLSPAQSSDQENVPPSPVKRVHVVADSPRPAMPVWKPADVNVLLRDLSADDHDIFADAIKGILSDTEKQMTVQQWIEHLAIRAEADLRDKGERAVGIFESEGRRALAMLESIPCS